VDTDVAVEQKCRSCGSQHIKLVPGFDDLAKVTSDCRPTGVSPSLAECISCGLSQKLMSQSLRMEIDQIYRDYVTYKDNNEPIIFSSDAGHSRSVLIYRKIQKKLKLGKTGTLVDLGCGDGAFLRIFAEMQPHWKLYGYDVSHNREDEIRSICGSGGFCTGSLESLPEQIDLVTLNYVAEHLDNINSVLDVLAPKMSAEGRISIVVPNLERNPYDVVVADHLLHYSLESIYSQLSAVMKVEVCSEFLGKEVFLSGTLTSNEKGEECSPIMVASTRGLAEQSVDHLRRIRDLAKALVNDYQHFGILGTAIAGSWLTCELDAETFFVEEDKRQHESKHLQRPVIAPRDVPPNACIFLPFAKSTAASIRERITTQTRAVIIDPWIC